MARSNHKPVFAQPALHSNQSSGNLRSDEWGHQFWSPQQLISSEFLNSSSVLRPQFVMASAKKVLRVKTLTADVVEHLLECCMINDHSQEDLFTRIVLVHHRLILDFYDMINIFPWNNHKKTVKWRRLPQWVVQLRLSPSELFCGGIRTVCVVFYFWGRMLFCEKGLVTKFWTWFL